MGNTVDFLTYYYMAGTLPFRSLSALPDEQAIEIMCSLYEETVLWSRFIYPAGYLHDRRETERWVREQFRIKGGDPRETCPVHMVLGASQWLVKHGPQDGSGAEIRIPLSVFTERDVSFTYPDSMISIWFGRDKPDAFYLPELHGSVFTVSEIIAIVAAKGMPEEDWDVNLPDDLAPYIEAQVWNLEPLQAYAQQENEQTSGRRIFPSGMQTRLINPGSVAAQIRAAA